MRPKHFAAALVLDISVLIAILTSFTLSAVATVLGINTAHFVDDLNENVSLILVRQQITLTKFRSKTLCFRGCSFGIQTRGRS